MRSVQVRTSNGNQLPLKDIRYNVDIHEHVANFTINQTYVNNETNPLEIVYTFPTPANASVHTFIATIGDKVIKANLKEKEQAKEEYNKAISQGHGAFYMERNNGDVFSVSLGNVEPGVEIVMTIKYVVELNIEIDCSRLRLNIPLTIMPRYTSYDFITEETYRQIRVAHSMNNPPKVDERPYTTSIFGNISMSDGIKSIDSKTCKIKLSNMKECSANFEISDLENLNEDLIVIIERGTPKSSCTIQRADNLNLTNELYRYATMVNIVPNYKEIPEVDPSTVHYTILIDRSGSMQGPDMEYCKQGAILFLLSLPEGSTYDIYSFDTTFEKFTPTFFDDVKMEAIEWINKIYARGGTELKGALEHAYASIKKMDKRGVILLLSDGGISDTESVLKLVKRNKSVNVFTIGIGNSVSQALIQGMADMGNGKAEFVNSGSDKIKEKIMAQLKRAQTSLRKGSDNNEVKINVDGDYKMVPEVILQVGCPTLYENDINTFFLFSQNKPNSITYVQNLPEYSVTTNIPFIELDNLDNSNNYPLHRMAGIKLIDSLANNPSGSQVEHLKQDPYKSEIIEASLNLNILSQYTAFVGIEYREEKDKTTQQCVLVEVPLQVAKKYSMNSGMNYQGYTGPQGICGPPGPCGPQGQYGQIRQLSASRMCDTRSFSNSIGCGINTIGSSLKNASYDIRSASICCIDSLESFNDSDADCGSGGMELFGDSGSSIPKYDISTTLANLPQFKKVGDLLTSTKPGLLPSNVTLKQGDYIIIIGQSADINGTYKVWNVGSDKESWVLEKVSNATTIQYVSTGNDYGDDY